LGLPGVAPEVFGEFDKLGRAGRADRMALGLQPATRIHRGLTAQSPAARFGRLAALASPKSPIASVAMISAPVKLSWLLQKSMSSGHRPA